MSIVQSKIGAVFIAVSDIMKAREWYCSLLGLVPEYDIVAGHLCCIPMDNNGMNIVLDSKIFSENAYARTPIFHFNTDDITGAYQDLKGKGVEIATEIQDGHWFNIIDPDGNRLMICEC
ncbi:VOC family protein [Bacillus sp. 1P06AnD]|uniref:VOC family protein n=1 Tax=Bacillus sp. 1P06AnD TaxID=3132208 RepID=UPI0039A1DCFA